MRKRFRKLTAVLLVVVMIALMIPITTISVSAGTVIENAISWALGIANDDSHGYSQLQNRRWGNPDYDCSTFVITAFANAGCDVEGATYTGNMRSVFENAGFTWIPKSQIDLSNSSQLVRGDILLNEANHTEIYIGNNQRVGAHTGTYDIYDRNSPGDNNGREISIYNYSNSSNWDGVLRYKDEPVVPTIPTGAITVVDGDYYISTALDNNKVLEIDDGHISSNSANAQLWDLLKETNQIFSVKHIGDGYYNLICQKSGKYLEVEGGNTAVGSNVQQYDGNGTDAQQWVIRETGDGYFYIISKCNGLYLDVDNASTGNGTNLKVFTGYSTNAQKWRFTLLGSHTFCDGDYYISSALNNNKVLDIDAQQISNNNANAQLWDLLKGQNQVFTVRYIGDGYYNIICKESGKYLEIENGYARAGANVQQYESNGTDAQQWVIKEVENNYFYIASKLNGLCLDVDNFGIDNGTNIKVYSAYLSNAQKWRFMPLGTQTISDGCYYISTALDIKKVLDIDAGHISDNMANAQLWELLNWENQVFSLKYNDNGYYNIICNKSGKYLEVEGANIEVGSNVQQYDGNGTDAQQWVIKEAGDGYYYIVSKCNGLYLDVDNRNTVNGTNVKVYTGYISDAQKWRFMPLGTQTIDDGEYYISTALDESKVLDIDAGEISDNNANAQLWELLNLENQVFSLRYNDNGYYNIICKQSGKHLEVEGGNIEVGSNVQQYDENGTDAQQWVIKPIGDGYFNIVSRCNGLYLDVDNGNTGNGTNIKVYTGYSTNAQKWKFVKYKNPAESSNSIGDTNLDGKINVNDVTAIQRHLADLETFTEKQLAVADTNGDGNVDIADATHLQMYLAEYGVVLGKQ